MAAPAAGQELARLPSTVTAPAPGPPLVTTATPLELRFPGRIASRERVLVELGPTGIPVGIRVRQRLVVRGKGDYSLSVPAPVVSVTSAPGSGSQPGGRSGLVLWQGFSPGRRTLAADAELAVPAAAPYLPLRFRVRRGPQGRVLTIRNVTGASVAGVAFRGSVAATGAAAALDELRAALLRDRPAGEHYVTVQGLEPGGTLRTEVPLRVTGTVRVAGRAARFSRIVRGDRPFVLRLAPVGPVDVEATAVPLPPLSALRPPRGASWAAAAEAGRLRGGEALLARVLAARVDAARYRQYAQFLANPDRLGSARTVYVYRTSAAAPAGPASTLAPGGTSSPLLKAVLAVGLVAGALTLVVWWAHS